MKIDRNKATLLVVDMQPRVLELIPAHQETLQQCLRLIGMCRDLEVPVQFSAHYPKGIGPVSPVLLEAAVAPDIAEKSYFSGVEDGVLEGRPSMAREQWIVCGIEAHACVMLTALDGVAAGKEVFVVVDAIAARDEADKVLALERMRAAGVVPVSREMVFFELLRRAGTPDFKACSRKYLQ